jgi:hypothetical protein
MNNSFVTYGCKTSTVHLRCIIINYTNCYNSTMSSVMDLVLKNKVDDSGSPGTPNRLPELFDSHELLSEVWWTMIDICVPYDSGGSTTDEWTSTVGRGRRVRTSWRQVWWTRAFLDTKSGKRFSVTARQHTTTVAAVVFHSRWDSKRRWRRMGARWCGTRRWRRQIAWVSWSIRLEFSRRCDGTGLVFIDEYGWVPATHDLQIR